VPHAQKQKLLAPSKNLKNVALIMMICGAILTVTVFAAFVGIPALLFGIWIWRRSTRNITEIEAAYSEYLAARTAWACLRLQVRRRPG
jgi:hypothetical protein